ncbi:uncharacterized protein LOC144378867 [Halichoerus grypus]
MNCSLLPRPRELGAGRTLPIGMLSVEGKVVAEVCLRVWLPRRPEHCALLRVGRCILGAADTSVCGQLCRMNHRDRRWKTPVTETLKDHLQQDPVKFISTGKISAF